MEKIKLSQIHEFCIENCRCNFHCVYCHSGYTNGENNHTSKPYFNRQWFDENLDMSTPVNKLRFWGGEPFANWDVYKEVIEYFYGHYTSSSFICNGSLFEKEKAKWLAEHNVRVHFSHDFASQSLRGIDFLKTDGFKQAAETMREVFAKKNKKYRLSLRKVYHNESKTFNDDIVYLEDVAKTIFPDWDFRISIAFGRGFDIGSKYVWKSENLLKYVEDCVSYYEENGLLAMSLIPNLLSRAFAVYDIVKGYKKPRNLCPATTCYNNHIPYAISSTGHLSYCHCYSEYPRSTTIRETCANCKRRLYCMGACVVTDNTAQCSEWAKLYDGLYEIACKFVEKHGYEKFTELKCSDYKYFKE